MSKYLLSAEERHHLELLGYRVVFSERGMVDPGKNTHTVHFPNHRPDAVSFRYSHATFPTPELAWAEAWQDFKAGNHLVAHVISELPCNHEWLID